MAKKKKKSPKPRGTWKINPKTRVKPSGKIYKRVKKNSNKKTDEDS